MPIPKLVFSVSRLFAAAAFALLAGCSTNPPQASAAPEEAQDESDDQGPGDVQATAPEPEDKSIYPNEELTENLLYEYLLA